jgi:hypothetical protein
MRTVLQPLNEKAAEIVVKHADLLQSSRMEPLLLQLVAHVMAYRVILKRRAAPCLPCDETCAAALIPLYALHDLCSCMICAHA